MLEITALFTLSGYFRETKTLITGSKKDLSAEIAALPVREAFNEAKNAHPPSPSQAHRAMA